MSATGHFASKRPWGTITKPDHMHLGYQKVPSNAVEDVTDRLYTIPKTTEPTCLRNNPRMSPIEVEQMVERLTEGAGDKASDSQRVLKGPLKKIGILNSFAWKGYN